MKVIQYLITCDEPLTLKPQMPKLVFKLCFMVLVARITGDHIGPARSVREKCLKPGVYMVGFANLDIANPAHSNEVV
jgi:hypothetical protein